jgi:hypothetical protein
MEEGYMNGLWVGTSTVFNIFQHLPFEGEGTTLYGLDLHAMRCYFTQERVEISNVFEIFRHFLFKGKETNPYGNDLHTI